MRWTSDNAKLSIQLQLNYDQRQRWKHYDEDQNLWNLASGRILCGWRRLGEGIAIACGI
jgi:hypothetical protein